MINYRPVIWLNGHWLSYPTSRDAIASKKKGQKQGRGRDIHNFGHKMVLYTKDADVNVSTFLLK